MNPQQPPEPQWSSDYFHDSPAHNGERPLGRGMVGHVQPLGALLMAHGIFELGFAVFAVFGMVASFSLPPEAIGSPRTFAVIFALIAIPGTLSGVLGLVSGYYMLRFRKRKLGMTTLLVGLVMVFTGYCAPTSIALAVYGLIVLLNDSVVAAFELGDAGRTTAEVHAAFPLNR